MLPKNPFHWGHNSTKQSNQIYTLAQLFFDSCNLNFKKAAHTNQDIFFWFLEQMFFKLVFYNNITQDQLPIPHQLALKLERL
ncbi:hypothetical protein VP01_1557g3 [Puccinia sorghi]|uniref:Uncharacterized protein n=1 Tax=Puccinia sorghi TaxID=27349 RepID=A0A0L6VI89_9BASI|nr:hypothetical protein VP01_1557g3 [Puccinia sorghi]